VFFGTLWIIGMMAG